MTQRTALEDTEKVLKMDPNNQEAKARKQRIEQKVAENTPLTPPPELSLRLKLHRR